MTGAFVLQRRPVRVLGLDVGSKTIGLALSDSEGLIASAWDVLARKGHEKDVAEVVARVQAREVECLVLGLPLELDGREGRRVRAVRRFLTVLEPALERLDRTVRVETWDERFSTAAAERTLLEADVSRSRRKGKIDAMAAQFILQGWLDAQASSREVGAR